LGGVVVFVEDVVGIRVSGGLACGGFSVGSVVVIIVVTEDGIAVGIGIVGGGRRGGCVPVPRRGGVGGGCHGRRWDGAVVDWRIEVIGIGVCLCGAVGVGLVWLLDGGGKIVFVVFM